MEKNREALKIYCAASGHILFQNKCEVIDEL
jgi:hypothetical protein